MAIILHICHQTAWDAAVSGGAYAADSLATEGFIHCSTPQQVASTANRYYRGVHGLLLLQIDTEKVLPPIRYEIATNGEPFPHLYGPLNLSAVDVVHRFEPGSDGAFFPPDDLFVRTAWRSA